MSVIGNAIFLGGGSSGGGEVYAAISVTYPAGSVCTATNGTTTLTAADTSGQVVFGIPEPSSTPETWTVSCAGGGESDSTTVDIEEYGQSEYVTLQYLRVYGAIWDGTSTRHWTRTDAAADFADPVSYVAGNTNYGSPFDNLYPWSDMTIAEDVQAGRMVKIPKFWYKLTQDGNSMHIQIADKSTDGYATCPACMDRGDGKGERDYILVGRYHCASTFKSASGYTPLVNKTFSDFSSGVQNLGSGIYLMDWATRFTIWLLYLVEFANWNSQATIGYGCGNDSAIGSMGYTDSMPYHTGSNIGSRATYGLGTQYRHIEGLWDNVLDMLDGGYYSSTGLYITINPANFGGQQGVLVGSMSGSGCPSGFSVKNLNGTFPLFMPTDYNGSTSTYSCDQWAFNSINKWICCGGAYGQNQSRGMFCFGSLASNGKSGNIGTRLMKLP